MRTALPEIATEQIEGTLPTRLNLLAVTDAVVFPGVVLPYVVTDAKQIRMIHSILGGKRILSVFLKRDTDGDARLFETGTAVKILKMFSVADGSIGLLLQAVGRIRFNKIVSRDPFVVADVTHLQDGQRSSVKLVSYSKALLKAFDVFCEHNNWVSEELIKSVKNVKEMGRMADIISANLNFSLEDRQQILDHHDIQDRLKFVLSLLNKEVKIAELSRKIQEDLAAAMDQNQKEYYLREQLKVIRRELGEDDSMQVELEELLAGFSEDAYPEQVRESAKNEIRRLSRMNASTSEFSVSRTYVDWLHKFPWNKQTEDNEDIENAREVLDRDHFGLEKIKERILEFLAVRKLTSGNQKGPILCFAGPPGVGKTSLGKSIADALGKNFIRIALGGVHDESEIRGHRRTYVGAMPGKIVQKLREADCMNPVFMMDEIDKLGSDAKGDPASALLEVLDPAQNKAFQDHYIDQNIDLSQVVFIATANSIDRIPGPLLDRMEVIQLPGYMANEKLEIAKRYIVPRQLANSGLKRSIVSFTKTGLRTVVEEYTRESGVRQLEQRVGSLLRKIAMRVVSGDTSKISLSTESIREMLGSQRVLPEVAGKKSEVGVVTGLAWTSYGGVLMFIESIIMPGNGRLRLTGSLGDVMRESGEIALSYIRARAKELKVADDFSQKSDIHVHFPEGATPKDGPSAGVAISTSLVSLLSGRAVRNDIAMTGEVSLKGNVLPIGGLREKVMAAQRAGINMVIAPADNAKDLEEIPIEIRNKVKIKLVSRLEEVFKLALI
jgi:ATP-dependent Lon protease